MVDRPTWQIELRPPNDPKDPDGTRRVRAALKQLLRSFQLTATKVVKVQAEKPAPVSEVTE